jgi:hypothetical protein
VKKIGTGTMPKGFSVAATRAPMPKMKPKTPKKPGMPRPTREHVLAGIVDGTVFETGIYSQYPECDKLLAARGKIQTLGEFLEWLGAEGIFLAEVDTRPGRWGHGGGHALISETTEKLLARYFEIDLDKVEAEKRAMLDAQRALNARTRTP